MSQPHSISVLNVLDSLVEAWVFLKRNDDFLNENARSWVNNNHFTMSAAWYPENIMVFDKNLLSRRAILATLRDAYPTSKMSESNSLSKILASITDEVLLQQPALLVIDFSGDKEAPLFFFNHLGVWFAEHPHSQLKILLYTSVEDCFFISAMASFISGGILLKSESVLSMPKMLNNFSQHSQVVLSDAVSKLVGEYNLPLLTDKELQGYFAELAEHRLVLSSLKTASKYKTFYSRRYNTIDKLGFKNVRQYYLYISKISSMLCK